MAIKKKKTSQIIVKKTRTDKYGNETVEETKSGVAFNSQNKHFNVPCLGMNKGVTVNMGDFQSLRVDVWLSLPLSDNPTSHEIEDTYQRIVSEIDDILDREIEKEQEED